MEETFFFLILKDVFINAESNWIEICEGFKVCLENYSYGSDWAFSDFVRLGLQVRNRFRWFDQIDSQSNEYGAICEMHLLSRWSVLSFDFFFCDMKSDDFKGFTICLKVYKENPSDPDEFYFLLVETNYIGNIFESDEDIIGR